MNSPVYWKPSSPISNLLKRSEIINQIRKFFNDRGLFEVETPAISQATVTDVHLVSFQTKFTEPGTKKNTPMYLTTSPEYHMKRLLAAGSGPIFQICHSFRNEEKGRYHNPEFTMLEWYRPHYDMYNIIDEVNDLLQQTLNCKKAETISYQQIFMQHTGIDPISENIEQLYKIAIRWNLKEKSVEENNRDTLLQLLFSVIVEPNIGLDRPTIVYHFPASQASLAAINKDDCRVADRFEAYFQGVELANGFRELVNESDQRQRFELDNHKREHMKLNRQPLDNNFLAALNQGIPECSGVALGVDRLVMIALKAKSLKDVIAFPIEIA